ANDEIPMWIGDKIYYMSDNGKHKRNNIWVYDIKTKTNRQITKFKKYDINFPSQGPDDIVFEAGGKLYILNLKTEKYNEVPVEVVSDFASIMPENKNTQNYRSYYNPSPDGNRILVEARGEIFSIPKEFGVTKNLSNSSSSAERYPAWSPDGKKIAYWSDKSGEYQMVVKDVKTGEEKTLTKFKNGYRYNIFWSPDSKKSIFVDQEGYFYLMDMQTGDYSNVDKIDGAHWAMNNFKVSWSNDSNWITYNKAVGNDNNAIFVYNVNSKEKKQLTSGFYDDSNPVFGTKGKYIFFTTTRSFSPIYSDYDATWVYPNATSLGFMTLQDSTASLLSERNDTVSIKKVEKGDKDKKEEKAKEKKEDKKTKKDKGEKKEEKTIKIDFAGIEDRMEILPVKAGNLGQLTAVDGKLIFMRYPNRGERNGKATLNYYDFKSRKTKKIIEGVNGYDVTADGKSIMVLKGRDAGIIKIAENQKLSKKVDFSNMNMNINPREEWHQIFREVWRLERDYFYDKNMHGVDWNKMYKVYSPLIDQCVTRYDVNFVIGQLLGEMNASHTYKGGGDQEYSPSKRVGYLGINWAKEGNLYKVAYIVKPASWETEVKSPLMQSGIEIEE
ncbi:MAG TPA: peptidase S41, partial [Bacteroidetes bacterium]|nr:peptidase S41 [Bacteroidota bacterium]